MAQKIAMTSPMNPVHVDLLIVTITILNAPTKNASTKVLFATVKMTVETNLMNPPVMVSTIVYSRSRFRCHLEYQVALLKLT